MLFCSKCSVLLEQKWSKMATFRVRGRKIEARVRVDGVSRSRSFSSRLAAQQWAKSLETEIRTSGTDQMIPVRKDTFGALIDRYVKEIKPLKPWGRTKDACLALIQRQIGHVFMGQLNSQTIVTFAQDRKRSGAGPATIAADISYISGVLRVARAVWRYDVSSEVVPDALVALKLLGLTGKSKQRDRRPTEAELVRITDLFNNNARLQMPMSDMTFFAVETAMRLGEITRIRWEDLDYDTRTILIRDRKSPTEKIGNNQIVPLLGDAMRLIDRQERRTERIFPFNSRSVGTNFARAVRRLNIADLRFHDLRHEGVSRLFEVGYQIQEVALVSGHKDWRMLSRYTQIKAKNLHRN